MTQNEKIKVSVLLITYNQEQYIQQAIDSILMQKTNFFFEVLIGEDCSQDNTQIIVQSYKGMQSNFYRVCTYCNEFNVGATRNLYQLIEKAKGKYIALLEGDDYWVGENRLQTLADFLDNHPEYSTVSHRRERRSADGKLLGYDPQDNLVGKSLSLKQFENGNLYSAMGCMFRNFYRDNPDEFKDLITTSRNVCDLILCYNMLKAGDVFIIDDVFGVYRVLKSPQNSNYCSLSKPLDVAKDNIAMRRALIKFYNTGKYNRIKICRSQFDMFLYFMKRGLKYELKSFIKKITLIEWVILIICFPYIFFQRISEYLLIHVKETKLWKTIS